MKATEIHLTEYPQGLPTMQSFRFVETEIIPPKDGEVTIRNSYMSVDPYMRGRMTGIKTYADPYQLNAVMTAGAVGEITASAHPDYKVGDNVLSLRGWRTAFTGSVEEMIPEGFRKIDTSQIPARYYLSIAGMPGMTAYTGLYRIADLKADETVLVSGAAGAVGAIVCQLAKAAGAYVVGIAGSDSKCEWLRSKGVDAAVNYKTSPDLTKSLQKAAPQGIDVYFENVGGNILEAALNVMNQCGRIAVCGMIAHYNNTIPSPGPNNMLMIVGKSLKIQGFIVMDHFHKTQDYIKLLIPLMAAGQISQQETIVDGIDAAPDAFLRLFSGEKQGKMLVKLV